MVTAKSNPLAKTVVYQSMSKQSIHSRFVAGFVRRPCGELVQCFGPAKNLAASQWLQIRQQILRSRCYNAYSSRLWQTTVQVELGLGMTDDRPAWTSPCEYLVFETFHVSTDQVLGIILVLDAASPSQQAVQLDAFFASLILGNLRTCTVVDETLLRQLDVDAVTESIVDLFDKSLRYAPPYDKWTQGGRDVFHQNVRHFTSRGQKVEFCLPAFPCKSSCTGKVLSKSPDRGEYLALVNMHAFIEGVEAIYPPGAKLWIISDGHVFSDCIGVDDDVVDAYGARLQAMNQEIVSCRGGNDRIDFRSLPELFTSHDGQKLSGASDILCTLPELCHHIATRMTEEAEMCRRILIMGFQVDDTELRNLLLSQDASTLALYRGFSKFMLEDLATNKYTGHLSRTQLRKKAAKVAFEMIQRNQAYSNLVQILFPHHVRLSIHAHDNSGPKFGIQTLGRGVIPTNVLPPIGVDIDCCDKLHVPTPWHNCIVEIEGDAHLYITKLSVAQEAFSSGHFVRVRHEDSGEGQFIRLRPRLKQI